MGLPQHLSRSVEHYTPSPFIEAARSCMGSIDLDPASCQLANDVVRAGSFYSLPKDGLVLPWHGNVWCNPPYGWRDKSRRVSNKELWSRRVIQAFEDGEIQAAVMLLTASTADPWFKQMWAWPICFPDHRINFWGPSGGANNPGSNAVFYIGHSPYDFAAAFDPLGRVVMPDLRYRDPNNTHRYNELLALCQGPTLRERKQLSIFECGPDDTCG